MTYSKGKEVDEYIPGIYMLKRFRPCVLMRMKKLNCSRCKCTRSAEGKRWRGLCVEDPQLLYVPTDGVICRTDGWSNVRSLKPTIYVVTIYPKR